MTRRLLNHTTEEITAFADGESPLMATANAAALFKEAKETLDELKKNEEEK